MQPRTDIDKLQEIPNVGLATVKYLNLLGIRKPADLIGQNPYSLYRELCKKTCKEIDPCLADVFISAVKFMEGEDAKKWWHYTEERKLNLRRKLDQGKPESE